MKETVLDISKKKVGEVELDDAVFGAKPNKALIYEVVKMQLACKRAGTRKVKNRSVVSGTTAKMYRQKGTGRARHGDMRAGIFVGGGKAFGLNPRDLSYRIPAKARKAGLRSALAVKKGEDKMIVLDDWTLPAIKTKDVVNSLEKLGVTSCLVVIDGENANLSKSARNIPNVKLVRAEGVNVYDLMKHDHVIFTKAALGKVQEVLKP